jgi:hypothetical protein
MWEELGVRTHEVFMEIASAGSITPWGRRVKVLNFGMNALVMDICISNTPSEQLTLLLNSPTFHY